MPARAPRAVHRAPRAARQVLCAQRQGPRGGFRYRQL